MKKLCLLIPGLNAGGIENYVLRFIKYLPDKTELTILVRNKEKGDLWGDYVKTGIYIRYQRIGYFSPLKWFSLYRYFKKEKFLTVCDFNGNFAGIVMLIAHYAGIKNIITFYRRSSDAFTQTKLRSFYNKIVNKLVYKHSTKILSNSQFAIDFFFPYRRIEDMRFKVIFNGIDPSIFNTKETKTEVRQKFNIPVSKFIIGHVGRFDLSKNHETIFRVAMALRQNHQDIMFVFAGRGTDSSVFHSKLIEYGIMDICLCLGLQQEVSLLFKAFDLFYFPSITEGQPNALIEAMVSGLPVLASDIDSIKEIFQGIENAPLINPKDVKSAKIMIERIVLDKSLLSNYIFKNEITDRFDMKKNFGMFLSELYND